MIRAKAFRRVLGAEAVLLALVGCDARSANSGQSSTAASEPFTIEIPESMRLEHEEIHDALLAAIEEPGAVGEAARALAEVLDPHFVREEQIALPPLGLLGPLARGAYEPSMREVLPMTDSLEAEWAQMLREHEVIAAAAVRLEEVARAEGSTDVERLARTLQAHARTEEEVNYPAAVLVGRVVRMLQDPPR